MRAARHAPSATVAGCTAPTSATTPRSQASARAAPERSQRVRSFAAVSTRRPGSCEGRSTSNQLRPSRVQPQLRLRRIATLQPVDQAVEGWRIAQEWHPVRVDLEHLALPLRARHPVVVGVVQPADVVDADRLLALAPPL